MPVHRGVLQGSALSQVASGKKGKTMLKETIAVSLVVAGVAVAVADTRDAEPMSISVQRDARKLPLDVSNDLRLDAALIRLPMEYAGQATRMRRAIGEHTVRDRPATARKRVATRACPHSIPAPEVARKLSSEPGGSSSKLAG
jgi:hypothetical protein